MLRRACALVEAGGLACQRFGAGRSKDGFVRNASLCAVVAMFAAGCALVPREPTPKAERLDVTAVRAFAARAEAAWNAHDFDRYYALCAPDAVFVSVRWNGDGSITRDRRTREEDRAAAEAYFKAHPGKFAEQDMIDKIEIAPDGRTAKILGHAIARISGQRPEILRSATEQTVALRNGQVLCMGQVDTAAR